LRPELGQRGKTGKGDSSDFADGRGIGVFSTWEDPILEPAKLFFPPLVVIFPSFLPGVVESLANGHILGHRLRHIVEFFSILLLLLLALWT
jgi:hypothetical protein